MSNTDAIDIFISSTCFDLADLRPELSHYLNANGFSVRVSEDASSAFYVEPLADSIATCLKNVESSKAIVAVIDRRYGGVLPEHSNYAGISATHAEIRHARKHNKPIRFFIREAALHDYHQLRSNPDYKSRWVEENNSANRERWTRFVTELFSLPGHADTSNWYDTFKNSVDLKALALRRLIDQFPEYRGSLAMRPDRHVRLTFISRSCSWDAVLGCFRNVGVGPALNIRHGIAMGGNTEMIGNIEMRKFNVGGLSERDSITTGRHDYFEYSLPRGELLQGMMLFCEYSNRFGDKYRVTVPLNGSADSPEVGPESVYVWSEIGGNLTWAKVI
jgi:hypothetical protein